MSPRTIDFLPGRLRNRRDGVRAETAPPRKPHLESSKMSSSLSESFKTRGKRSAMHGLTRGSGSSSSLASALLSTCSAPGIRGGWQSAVHTRCRGRRHFVRPLGTPKARPLGCASRVRVPMELAKQSKTNHARGGWGVRGVSERRIGLLVG